MNNTLHGTLYSLLLILFPYYCLADSYDIADFSEKYTDDVNVSGGVLAAYAMQNSSNLVITEQLYIKRDSGVYQLTVKILSKDGKYNGKLVIQVQEDDAEWIIVDFPSQHKARLENYQANELSVLVLKDDVIVDDNSVNNNRVERIKRTVYPASWGKPDINKQVLLINSASPFAKLIFKDSLQGKQSIYCQPLPGETNVSFNYSCTIPEQANIHNGLVLIKTSADAKGKLYQLWSAR